MTRRILRTGAQARKDLIAGATTLAEAVKLTLGPHALTAALEKGQEIIDDGATIAREIVAGCIPDEIEELGARMLEKVSGKTDETVGDGTTSSIVWSHAILKEIARYLSDGNTFINKKNPADIIRQIENELKEVIAQLRDMAKPIKTEKQLVEATIVSSSDEELGTLIGKAQFALGKDGYVLAEETTDTTCSIESIKGVKWDNGLGTRMVMNNPAKQSLEQDEIKVLLTNYVLQDLNPIKDLLKSIADSGGRSVLLIARAFGSNAIRDCLENINVGFRILPINCPYVNQNEIMADIGAVTGARYVYTEDSFLEQIKLSDLGWAAKIVAYPYTAIITGKSDDETKKRVEDRVEELRKKLLGATSEFEKSELNSRIAQLTNGFAIAKIGAESDLRRKYLKRKADDAVSSTRAALQEGVVDGGGLALKQISDKLPDTYILKRPLLAVYNQIMASAPEGFKIESWVKDPVKVLRVALEQACSVASAFATTGIAITSERPKPIDTLLKKNASNGEADAV